MRKCMFAFFALAISLFGTQCWAQENCSFGEGNVSCTFSPGTTRGVFEFGDHGRLVVDFDTVLTTFTLTVNVSHPNDSTESPLPLDPNEFPPNTHCVTYVSSGFRCDQYDFTGNASGPNNVPVKNKDYKGLITLTLSYLTTQTAHNPAFGHAPGDITTFTENILTNYSTVPLCDNCDPTMGGKTPGLSSVIALDEPLADNGNDTACPLTLTPTNNPSGQKSQIEVALKIVSGSDCSAKGLRDKTASLSVSTTDGTNVTFPALKNVEGNKFHWDSKNGLNEYDISTDGLVSGHTYTVTAFSSKVSPQSASFIAP